jgi:hypothetical protein
MSYYEHKINAERSLGKALELSGHSLMAKFISECNIFYSLSVEVRVGCRIYSSVSRSDEVYWKKNKPRSQIGSTGHDKALRLVLTIHFIYKSVLIVKKGIYSSRRKRFPFGLSCLIILGSILRTQSRRVDCPECLPLLAFIIIILYA